ncbi:MAG: hypothetical protein PHR45_08885 [Muribaculaceae bacterium]|nr:hypothetical protein [Muribaculaceae bacterium]
MIDATIYYRQMKSLACSSHSSLSSRIRIIGVARLCVFIATSLAIYFVWGNSAVAAVILIAGIVAFLALIKTHEHFFLQRELCEARISIADDNINRISLNLDNAPKGEKYIDSAHAYSYDIDIFGNNSIFSLLDTTCTVAGADVLAEWLSKPLGVAYNIAERQDAIKELAAKPDFRADFRAYGISGTSANSTNSNNEIKAQLSNRFFRITAYVFPFIMLASIMLWLFGLLDGAIIGYLFALGVIIAGAGAKNTARMHRKLAATVDNLTSKHQLLQIIENENFNSPLLNDLKNNLVENNIYASSASKKLARILTNLDQRYNVFSFSILNGFLMWDYRQLIAADKWYRAFGSHISRWKDITSQVDALCSIATFAFNNPHYIFPAQDKDKQIIMQAHDLRHPLILHDKCVPNDVATIGNGTFQVITGANMAGKSTYLRTIAVNFVLASIGSPVAAKDMIFSPVELLTGLRTTDSLHENESYFFAELKRLKYIIDRATAGKQMLVILDEILKGTNSVDKQKGSLGLVEKLTCLNVGGIIATHDLMLGSLADKFPNKITNYRFESNLSDNSLIFPYKIMPGIAKNMNAYFLMQKMNII